MTSGNRVEELETQVAELQATVKGLTEELVEANDRIRQIEAALGGEEGTDEFDQGGEVLDDERLSSFVSDDADPEDVAEAIADPEDATESGADGGEATETGAEADKSDEADGGDEGELDDIIVA